MPNITIRSHKPGRLHLSNHIFILNKGLNSGKPLYEPCPNCFIIEFSDEQDRQSYYWLAYSLWKSGYWRPFLVGSVIPFLRIDNFKCEFEKKTNAMLSEYDTHLKNIRALQLLEQKEVQFHKNLILIADMRRVILYRYINKQ